MLRSLVSAAVLGVAATSSATASAQFVVGPFAMDPFAEIPFVGSDFMGTHVAQPPTAEAPAEVALTPTMAAAAAAPVSAPASPAAAPVAVTASTATPPAPAAIPAAAAVPTTAAAPIASAPAAAVASAAAATTPDASPTAAPTIPLTDDSACVFNLFSLSCKPQALCSYQLRLGDVTPSQSCRVRPGGNKLPQQIHLAYAGAVTGTGMAISWATFEQVPDSGVWIGTSLESLVLRPDIAVSTGSYYSEGKYSQYHHHATVTGLTPNTKYFYKVGSASSPSFTSEISTFTTARVATDTSEFEIAIYGDLGFGTKGEASTEYINTLGDKIAMVYHIGDIGYADTDFLHPTQALGFFYEEAYNKWMNSMMPIMSKVPYMVTVGNHEAECHSPACFLSQHKRTSLGNYAAYNARFKMPSVESAGVKNMWYSFEYGPIHFTTISSETDYPGFPSNGYTLSSRNGNFGNQLAWLEADLQKAAANRANVPWIIVGMHRPIYHRLDADRNSKPTGDSLALQKAFEELFIKYQVDLVVAGHEHSYERHFPIARGAAVLAGVSEDGATYSNPKAPVYIVTGGPGNPEANKASGRSGFIPWNVMETSEYGISTMRVTRNSLTLKYVATSNQRIVDEFVITKN